MCVIVKQNQNKPKMPQHSERCMPAGPIMTCKVFVTPTLMDVLQCVASDVRVTGHKAHGTYSCERTPICSAGSSPTGAARVRTPHF